MSALFDSKFEKGAASQASPFLFASNAGTVAGTVTGANANRALVIQVTFSSSGTAPVVTWNGVAATQLGAPITTPLGLELFLFGLINPAGGNNTLQVSWTGGAMDVSLGAISLYDADQATCFQNYNSNTGTSTSSSSTITTASGNMVVAARVDDNASSAAISSGTQDWDERSLNGNYGAGHKASAGASEIISWTLGSSVAWGQLGIDVIAFSGGGGAAAKRLMTQGVG